nr:hypothetical protein CFP56_22147 [Quercus suber]
MSHNFLERPVALNRDRRRHHRLRGYRRPWLSAGDIDALGSSSEQHRDSCEDMLAFEILYRRVIAFVIRDRRSTKGQNRRTSRWLLYNRCSFIIPLYLQLFLVVMNEIRSIITVCGAASVVDMSGMGNVSEKIDS